MSAFTFPRSRFRWARTVALSLLGVAALSGCHVTVTETPGHGTDHPSAGTPSVAHFDTGFLVRHALVPYALTAGAIDMIADPEGFLSPRSRTQTRHHLPVETTSTYLFASGPCDFGGATRLEAQGETETYTDAMTFVSMDVIARADECELWSREGYVTLNGRLDYRVSGWHDDLADQIASLDGRMTGYLRLNRDLGDVNYSGMVADIIELSATDFHIDASAGLWLDDGWQAGNATLDTSRGVHWARGDRFPHAGTVKLTGVRGWVELRFSDSGVRRDDSLGNRQYWTWSSLE